MLVCEVEYLGHSLGDEPLNLTKCYSCGLSQLYETLRGGCMSVAKPKTCGYKRLIFFSSFILYFCFSSTVPLFLFMLVNPAVVEWGDEIYMYMYLLYPGSWVGGPLPVSFFCFFFLFYVLFFFPQMCINYLGWGG